MAAGQIWQRLGRHFVDSLNNLFGNSSLGMKDKWQHKFALGTERIDASRRFSQLFKVIIIFIFSLLRDNIVFAILQDLQIVLIYWLLRGVPWSFRHTRMYSKVGWSMLHPAACDLNQNCSTVASIMDNYHSRKSTDQ